MAKLGRAHPPHSYRINKPFLLVSDNFYYFVHLFIKVLPCWFFRPRSDIIQLFIKFFFIETARNDNKGFFIWWCFSETDFRCLELFPLLATWVYWLVRFDFILIIHWFYFFTDIEVVFTLDSFDISYLRYFLNFLGTELTLTGLAVRGRRHHHFHVLLTTIKTLLK